MQNSNLIMQEYLSTSKSLTSILIKHVDQNQYLETVFLELMNEESSFDDKVLQEDINQDLLRSIDKAIITGHPDPNLYLLFIARAIIYNCNFLQIEKANSLNSIGCSFSNDEIQPIVKAMFTQYRARIFRLEGNTIEYRKLMDEASTLVDKAHPKYYILAFNYGNMLAIQGELIERGEYKLSQFDLHSLPNQLLQTTMMLVLNAIITGNYVEGNGYIEEYKKQSKKALTSYLEYCKNLLKIIAGEWKESDYSDILLKHVVRAYQSLSLCKFEMAIKHQKLFLKENIRHHFLNTFGRYLELHYEINVGNKGMAKMLLQEKKQKGGVHFIDDLFYGRVQLLENDETGADQSFTRLIENINRFGAHNRLAFELEFAKEMKLSTILRLLNGWKSADKITTAKAKIDILLKPKVLENGIKLLIGSSSAINQVKELVKKYATLKAPILVTGETGTGKELVSRAIHDEGLFPKEPFLAINCGALTDNLLQSELFGYEAGAFTGAQKQRKGIFEAAGKGTVFLDEFGEISPKLQVSLLRVLEANEVQMIGSTITRKIECKIVIATNVDLHNSVVEKKFREDLFFRIARFEIKLPSLRERIEDLPELIQYFLDSNNSSGAVNSVSNGLLVALSGYHWPGNIRELKNEIDRLFILNPDIDILDLEHFDFTHLQEIKKPEIKSEKTIIDFKNTDNTSHNDSELKIIQKGFPIEKRHARLKELFLKYKKLTRYQIMELLQIGATTATKDLQALIEAGLITRRSPTNSRRTDYFEIIVNSN